MHISDWSSDVCSSDLQIPNLLIGGILGPRGDAYGLNRDITAESAEEYHAVQLETLKRAQVDFACAMTFNNIPEATGAARAAARIGVPLSVALTLDSTHRLKSGPTLGEAITEIDAQTGLDAPDYRSEEHTSELQSLMRISYAVFCLKKKNKRHMQR